MSPLLVAGRSRAAVVIRRGCSAPKAGPHRFRGGDGHGQQLPGRGGGGLNRGPPCGQAHLQHRPPRAGLGLGQSGAGQCVAGGTVSVDRIGLGPGPARRPLGPVQLHDQFAGVSEMTGQAGAVAAGALHRPGPQPGVLLGQGAQLGIAIGICGHRHLGQHAAGACVDDRGGVGVFVGVDADDDLDQLCQHGHAFFSLTGGRSRSRSGAEMAGL
jgi:hypothetical protein